MPDLVSDPVPVIAPVNVPANAWLKSNAASLRMLPWMLVEVPASVPAVIVVPPV